jgi:hypothetical protein
MPGRLPVQKLTTPPRWLSKTLSLLKFNLNLFEFSNTPPFACPERSIAMRFLAVPVILCLLCPLTALAFDPGSSCVKCHGQRETMRKLGAESMYLDPAEVDREVHMEGKPTCVDCHLGNPKAPGKDKAHAGMLRPLLMVLGPKRAGQAMSRSELGLQPLLPRGKGVSAMVPKPDPELAKKAGVTGVKGIFWHDRDPKTFYFSPYIAQKTCGKCHGKETIDYSRSGMGLLKFQRADRSFAERLPGPHNCGPWFGENYERLAAETAVPFSRAQNDANARNCNVCHPGCNDCHYQPFKGEGRHLFGRPDAVTCYGGRRGTICHAGPMERRRGAGFLRDEYAFPGTLYAGLHKEKGLTCLDCHSLAGHRSGQMANPLTRRSCGKCHPAIVEAVAKSNHAKVDCAACHVDEVGGYQLAFWGPGDFAGNETPYAKHAGYYGVRDLPTLIRNPEGRWLAYKPYPMAVLNQKKSLEPGGVQYRAIPKRTIPGDASLGQPASFIVERTDSQTSDALIINGTRSDLPGGHKAILWIQMDKISHALGPARDCDSCHASHAQSAATQFSYWDKRNVTTPIIGSYKVVADRKGMRFIDLKYSEITLVKGKKATDFAPFTLFPDAWNVKGIDFSIPFDETKVHRATASLKAFLKELDAAGKTSAGNASLQAELEKIKAVAWHNLGMARDMWAKSQPSMQPSQGEGR